MVNHFDYIICGAGAAGLSLLMQMMKNQYFDNKKILVVDKAPKTVNDRTWCYWEKEEGIFEPVVYQSWEQVYFYSSSYSSLLQLAPYRYKMIRGIDFYNYVYQAAAPHTNVTFVYGNVEAAGNEGDFALVIVDGQKYTASYVFNSIMIAKPLVPAGKYYLLQHFKGWTIETAQPSFDMQKATLMDFRVSQHHGTTFAYVLPVSPTKALVEYTLFTKDVLPQQEYDNALKQYINEHLRINEYTVHEEEFGVIPMTNIKFTKNIGRVINIGTAGGQTKASSGYTFRFIQKQAQQLVNDLVTNNEVRNHSSMFERRFQLYDSTLLNILHNNTLGGDRIFADLFKKNPADRVLRFLDNESDLEDELNIMGSVPSGVFMKAAFSEIFK